MLLLILDDIHRAAFWGALELGKILGEILKLRSLVQITLRTLRIRLLTILRSETSEVAQVIQLASEALEMIAQANP